MHVSPLRDGRTFVKVAFELPRDSKDPAWPPASTETLWAEHISSSKAILRNVPFYVYGIALEDAVQCRETTDAGVFDFVRVVSRSGHSTYRIFALTDDRTEFEERWQGLELLGCRYEAADNRLFAVDMAPNVDVRQAYKILQRGSNDGVWDFEEGYFHGHPQA